MSRGIATPGRPEGGDLVKPVGLLGSTLAQLSVSPGNYIITATCSMHLRSGANPVIYTIGLTLGDGRQQHAGVVATPSVMHIAAITMGASVDHRSTIVLTAFTNDANAEVVAVNPSITAVQVDELSFTRMPRSVTELLRTTVSAIVKLLAGR